MDKSELIGISPKAKVLMSKLKIKSKHSYRKQVNILLGLNGDV